MTDESPQGLPAKQLSPGFVTGSGGSRFENNVQAAFALLMLSGGSCPFLRRPIKKLILQARTAGYHTDDIVVFVEDQRGGSKARLLGQIKHNVAFTQGNQEFSESIAAAWRDFSARTHFDPATDIFALITGPLSAKDIDDVRPMLRLARQNTAETFAQKMSLDQSVSEGQRTKLAAFRSHLDTAKGTPVTDAELWGLLSRFHIMGFDFDDEAGTSLSLLESHLSQFKEDGFSFVWARIAEVVFACNQAPGELMADSFPQEVKDVFKKAPVEIPPELLRAAVEAAQAAPPPLAGDQANALMLAALLGSWNEKTEGDMDAAKKLIE